MAEEQDKKKPAGPYAVLRGILTREPERPKEEPKTSPHKEEEVTE